MNDQIARDLIKVLLLDLAERVPFGPSSFNDTPFTRAVAELAQEYDIPSITETSEAPQRFIPQIPEGKIKNG